MLIGFYRAQIPNSGGKFMACTQFQACDARRAFPCWDEPAIKATFTVTLCVSPEFTAISNMPVETESVDATGLRRVTFEKTPVMVYSYKSGA